MACAGQVDSVRTKDIGIVEMTDKQRELARHALGLPTNIASRRRESDFPGANMSMERPILFNAEDVRAILSGRKTQTRRVVKPQSPDAATSAGVITSNQPSNGEWSWLSGDPADSDTWGIVGNPFRCPFGVPGDRLWVKETWAIMLPNAKTWPIEKQRECTIYRASHLSPDELVWKSPIHMPRWASRITLEITDVRVQRLQEISNEDVCAEGVIADRGPGETWYDGKHQDIFARYWDRICGPESWDRNDWVWVIAFMRAENG